MASIKVYPGDDIIKQLQQMADIDNIAPKCISAAAPVVKKALKKKLKPHRKTGDMEKSIVNTKPKKNKQGWYAKVYFSGEDRKGVSNLSLIHISAYIKQRIMIDGGMCETCGTRPGKIVHHKVWITPDNINNPDVTLNLDNLKYDCQECRCV